ncbi:SAM-dependent chlorinase/fluorinase [Pirellulales bacterium]|nr:SAM-dependent chlorinase/fluorinase [Pirellulales bacterium]MDB4365715.1 SAM-dependent chlorinase/fluorinase [Pirellulales bacterium]
MTSLVTFTTDFGTSSGYVAQMKGVFFKTLYQGISGETSPLADCQLIDLAHDIPEHDIRSAAWFANTSCFLFPPQTLHIMVVDPGVGTSRQIIYVEMGGQRFLVPNNGLLSLSARQHTPTTIHPVQSTLPASKTFHGRDIFAPTAAEIVLGRTSCLGPVIPELLSLSWPETKEHQESVDGEIVHIDHFGNLITNLPDSLTQVLQNKGQLSCDGTPINHIVSTYGEAKKGSIVGLAGSQGFVEIAVVEGRADKCLNARIGTPVRIAR